MKTTKTTLAVMTLITSVSFLSVSYAAEKPFQRNFNNNSFGPHFFHQENQFSSNWQNNQNGPVEFEEELEDNQTSFKNKQKRSFKGKNQKFMRKMLKKRGPERLLENFAEYLTDEEKAILEEHQEKINTLKTTVETEIESLGEDASRKEIREIKLKYKDQFKSIKEEYHDQIKTIKERLKEEYPELIKNNKQKRGRQNNENCPHIDRFLKKYQSELTEEEINQLNTQKAEVVAVKKEINEKIQVIIDSYQEKLDELSKNNKNSIETILERINTNSAELQ